MQLMSGRAIRITARIVFVLCGLTTLLTVVPYALLQGADLPYQSEWVAFVAVLGLVGGFSVVVALLPLAWIAKVCGKNRDDDSLFSKPLRLLGGFALVFYLVGVVAHFAPRTWNLPDQLMFCLCPMYLVRMTIDPSPLWVFLILAPMNAAVFGALGATLGFARMTLRRH